MSYCISDIFSIGIGPSSSHTVGPMKAARDFLCCLPRLDIISRICITVYGSLAYTGQGHGTHTAILMGLEGHEPKTINTESTNKRIATILEKHRLNLMKQHAIEFHFNADFVFNKEQTQLQHPNTMTFTAYNDKNELLEEATYFSIGGGFIEKKGQAKKNICEVAYPFKTADDLFSLCQSKNITVSELMLQNQLSYYEDNRAVQDDILTIERVMHECIHKGIQSTGVLPGPQRVSRRAAEIHQKAIQNGPLRLDHPDKMNWLNLYALAVNEENAAGNRVVTAPTNGAAGIMPAITQYHRHCDPNANDESIVTLFLTAAAICILYKENASISGAEMGCQGEVGVACSMAAAGLTAARGGSLIQIEKAAEIAMEHNLGLTCDPVNGQVQIPCIERNGMGAVKAVNASSLALINDEPGKVSLDAVINTMREIGQNMSSIYKETSKGGLAVNIIEC